MRKLLRRAVPALCLLLLVAPPAVGPAAGAGSGEPASRAVVRRGPVGGPAGASAVGGPASGFDWPLAGRPRPVRRFDPPPQPWLPGHRGVDLAGPAGGAVRAAGAGIVLFAGPVAGRPVVTVGHPGGLRTTYEPVRPGLSAGARVQVGTPIGTLLAGHPGCPAEACLHWGLRRGEEYLDPLALLGLGPVRLLPLEPAALTPAGPPRVPTGAPPGRRPAAQLPGEGAATVQPWASSAGRRTASRSYSSGVL